MNKTSTIYALIFSFLVFILAFLYLHFVMKNNDHIYSLIETLIALANSVFVALIAGTLKISRERNGVKIESFDESGPMTLLEKEPKVVAIGTLAVFVISLIL